MYARSYGSLLAGRMVKQEIERKKLMAEVSWSLISCERALYSAGLSKTSLEAQEPFSLQVMLKNLATNQSAPI